MKKKTRLIKPATAAQIAQGRKALIAGTAVVPVAHIKGPPPPPTPAQVQAATQLTPGQLSTRRLADKLAEIDRMAAAMKRKNAEAFPERVSRYTHTEYKSTPDKDGVTTTVVVPFTNEGNFASAKGTVTHFTRGTQPVATAHAPVAPARTTASATRKVEGVCAFIEDLIMHPSKSGYTKQEIVAKVLEAFPGRDPASTLNTVGIRPTFLRKRGLVPPPFRKQ